MIQLSSWNQNSRVSLHKVVSYVSRFFRLTQTAEPPVVEIPNDTLSVEVLETRLMLDGDGSTDVSEQTLSTMFDLPEEVGQALVNVVENSGLYASGPWQAGTSTNFSSSKDWHGANTIDSPNENSWRDYLIDDTAPTGLIQNTTNDSTELQQGGFLAFRQDAEQTRTVDEPSGGTGGQGGATAGGIVEDNLLGSLQKETISTTNKTSYIWVDSQQDVDSISSATEFNPADYSSYFQIIVNNDFVYDDLQTTGNQIRSFRITNTYEISVSYSWTGTATHTEFSENGTTVSTINYNTSGTLLFSGEHTYVGTVAPDPEGQFIESYELSGAGDADFWMSSDNVVSSIYSEGDLETDGFGTTINITIEDDYLLTSSSLYNYSGDGNRNTATDDGDIEYSLVTTDSYELFSSPTITTSYETVQDRTIEFNEDIINAWDSDGDGTADAGEDTPDPITLSSAIFSASGSSELNSYLHAYGNGGLSFGTAEFYGDAANSTLDSENIDHWNTTGSTFSSDSQYNLVVTSPGYYYTENGSGGLVMESDEVGNTHAMTFITSNTTSADEDPDLEGFMDVDTTIGLARTKIDTNSSYQQRLVTSATIGDEDNPSEATDSTAATEYLNDFVSEGIDEAGAANNPSNPQAVDGLNILYQFTEIGGSNTFEQTSTDAESNYKIEFLTGDASKLILDGSSQADWTNQGEGKLALDDQFTSGDIETGNGQYAKDHYSVNNTHQSHGSSGGNYNLEWLFEEGAFTEVPVDDSSGDSSGDSTGDSATTIEVDETKITLTGATSANTSSAIDSDVTTTKTKSKAAGRYVEGSFDANDNPLDTSTDYRLEKWSFQSDFTEVDNLTGGSSSSAAGNFTAATQSSQVDTSSNYASDISGSGSDSSSYSLDVLKLNGTTETTSEDGSTGEVTNNSIPYEKYELHYSYVSDSTATSSGADSVDFARNQLSKITDNSVVDDSTGDGSGDGGTGGGGAPGPGGPSDGQQDLPPEYTLDLDENRTLSNSGITTLDNSSSYGIDVNSPSFQLDYSETYTGMSGMDDGVVATHEEVHLTSVNNAPHTDVSFADETNSEYEWREDGLYLVTNGYTQTTLTSSGETYNHGDIIDRTEHDYGDGNTKTVTTKFDPNDYHVTYNDTITIRDDYEDFGQKVNYALVEDTGDTVETVGGGIEASANGVGMHTRTVTSVGDESLTYKPTSTEDITTPFGGGLRVDNIELTKTGNWSLTDEVVGDFEEGGSYSITYTPSGFRNSSSTLITNGTHAYNYSDDVTDDEGYLLETEQAGWYNSTTNINSDFSRSGSVVANYASDGVLVAASGSLINTINTTGDAVANEDTIVNKTKSRTVEVPESDTSGSGGGSVGGPGGGTPGPKLTSTDDVYTAGRRIVFGSNDNFASEQVIQYDAGVGTDGQVAITHNESASSLTNNVWGSRSGSDSSFVMREETDHYDDGSSSTETTYIKAPESFSLDGSYGNSDAAAANAKDVSYAGFFTGDETDDPFNSAGYVGQVIDTSYDQGANVTQNFGTASDGHGTEQQVGFSMLQDDQERESGSEQFGGDQVFALDPSDVVENYQSMLISVAYQQALQKHAQAMKEYNRHYSQQGVYPTNSEGKIPFMLNGGINGITSADQNEEFAARMSGVARVSGAVLVVLGTGGSALVIIGTSAWAVDQTQAGVRQIYQGEVVKTGGQIVIESAAGEGTVISTAGTFLYEVGPDVVLGVKNLASLAKTQKSLVDDLGKTLDDVGEVVVNAGGVFLKNGDELVKVADDLSEFRSVFQDPNNAKFAMSGGGINYNVVSPAIGQFDKSFFTLRTMQKVDRAFEEIENAFGAAYAGRIRQLYESVPKKFVQEIDDFGEFIVRRPPKAPVIQLANNFGNAKIMAASILHEVRHLRQYNKLGRTAFLNQGVIRAEKFATAPNIVQGKRLGLADDDLQYFIDYYEYWRR